MTDTFCALYRFFDQDGDLLYIGLSANPAQRIMQHCGLKTWALQIALVELEWFSSRALAAMAEKEAVAAECLRWNVHYSDTPGAGRVLGIYNAGVDRREPATWYEQNTSPSSAPASSSTREVS